MAIKKYINEDLSIIWKPKQCMHSGICFRGLPQVFNPGERPWVKPLAAGKEAIIEQIKKCPSGALSFELKNEKEKIMESTEKNTYITVSNKGPYLVKGTFVFVDQNGNEEMKEGNIALCRCGASSNKPFCDGSHRKTNVLDN